MKWPTRVSVSVGPRQCAFFILDLVANKVKNAVFDLFDRDDNNIAGTFLSGVLVCLRWIERRPASRNRTQVDMMELICGISLLCHGSEAGVKGGVPGNPSR